MRTTAAIDDHLLARAREQARQCRQTLGQLIEDALRTELANPAATVKPPAVPVFKDGTGPRPGVDLTSNRALRETLDEDTSLHKLQ